MKQTLKQYAAKIQANKVNPLVECGKSKKNGLVFDPAKKSVPLNIIAFGIYHLKAAAVKGRTGKREYVFVPQAGKYTIECGEKTFKATRKGGPFAALPAESNASAVYIPQGTEYRIKGSGEVAFFSAPAYGDREAAQVEPGEVNVLSRGRGPWRRDIFNLVSAGEMSTNLTVGETYSPPALWSGTPLHIHDRDDEKHGQSDLEEVYYHRARYAEGKWGSYGVQLLFDEKNLKKAFIIKDKSAVAIPGGAHPVVSGPVSDMLYLWGLAGKGKQLLMWDIPEFSYLKRIEEAMSELDATRAPAVVSGRQLKDLQQKYKLPQRAMVNLMLILRESGYKLEM